MSYRKKHVKNKLQRLKPRKSIFTRLWFWIVILILAIICTGLYFGLFYSGVQLKNVEISGNDRTKTQDLQNLVWNSANTGLINFWTINIFSRSIFVINDEKINRDILKNFPMVKQVSINKKFPQTLTLGVVERKPVGVFCPSTVTGQANSQCFLIDNNGIAFEPLSVSQSDLVIVRQASTNDQIYTGEEVLNQGVATAVSKIEKTLKDDFQIDLKEALVSTPTRLDIKTGENWKIYFDLDPNFGIDSQIVKLNALLVGDLSQDKRKSLRYIDLRPKDRAIVCNNATCGGK